MNYSYFSKRSYTVFRTAIDASLIPLRTLDRFLSLLVSIVSSFVENSSKRIIVDLFEFLLRCYAKALLQHLVQDFTLTKNDSEIGICIKTRELREYVAETLTSFLVFHFVHFTKLNLTIFIFQAKLYSAKVTHWLLRSSD